MGNRAIIKPVDSKNSIYLHWNGGRDSVEAFLKYCELKGYRGLGEDTSYGLARLTQVISNFFGGTTSVGICSCDGHEEDSPGDNGIYIVKGWEIVDRVDCWGEQREYELDEMLIEIDNAQPESEQLGGFLTAEKIPTDELKIDDVVYIQDWDGKIETFKVIGFGEKDQIRNGRKVENIPYVNHYDHDGDYSWNVNNYILDKTVRIMRKERD